MNRSERCARPSSPNGEWVFNTGAERDAAGALVIDDAAIAEWPGRPLNPAVADLIELAAAVQMIDRMERRPPARCGGDSWARELRLVVGVRNPDLWRADGVTRQLRELLVWLTDDDWVIDFVARAGSVRPGESFRFLFPNPTEGEIASLYSGGLDSFAGLALELSEDTVPVLVSVVPNTRQGASQSHTLGSLQEQFGVAVPRVAVKCHLRGMQSRESSNRTRGFGFLAVAASVAAMSDISTVHVYENGIGAINLPYSRAQGGAQSTRSMHPKTLQRAGASSRLCWIIRSCSSIPTSIERKANCAVGCLSRFVRSFRKSCLATRRLFTGHPRFRIAVPARRAYCGVKRYGAPIWADSIGRRTTAVTLSMPGRPTRRLRAISR